MKAALCLLALLLTSGLVSAEENYLHQSVGATMLVADPAVAADRLEAWAENEGGYTLYKSDERVSLRLPHPRLGELRGFLERLSEDILEYSPQAVDLREQLARAQSSLASRRDILTRNLALLDQADTAGTLAIEREMLGLIQEVENLQAAVQKLTVDRTYARVEIGLRFVQSALPEDIPSSFAWINQVSFFPFIEERNAIGSGVSRFKVQPPSGYATAGAGRNGSYRALSPEGLPFRVRAFKNTPEQTLPFWSEALKSHLQKEGYRLAADGRAFQAGSEAGQAYEWVVPYDGESYLYQTALIVTGKRIILAEAAGPYPLFVDYRRSLEESLQSIRLR